MELLLNLLWAMLTVSAFYVVVRQPLRPNGSGYISRCTMLLALGCALVLLFPVVSASDDLHAGQALTEDAMKRVHQGIAPLQQVKHFGSTWLFLSLLSLNLLFALVLKGSRQLQSATVIPGDRQRLPQDGRSPPILY